MRIVFFLVLLAGIGMAGFGMYALSQKYNTDQREMARLRTLVANQTELGPVIVATAEMRYGSAISPDEVRIVEWPLNSRPPNVFTSMEELFGEDGTPRRAVTRLIETGEAIMRSKVTNFGQDAGVSSRLERGMRAFTIRVDVASGVSGFLNPGDRIDIFWSGSDGGRPLTKLILENVGLIAIDQIADEDTNRPIVARTVTVQVSPLTVAALAQAQATGKLSLSLRGAEDDLSSGPIEVDQDALIGRVEQVVQQERVCTVKVRKGEDVVEIPTECPPEE